MTKPITLEEIEDLLSKLDIQYKYVNHHELSNFSRTIEFYVYNIQYQIIWYKNESYIQIGNNIRAPQYPFRYMYLDTTAPIAPFDNKSLAFAYVEEDDGSGRYPWGVFRIPLEIPPYVANNRNRPAPPSPDKISPDGYI